MCHVAGSHVQSGYGSQDQSADQTTHAAAAAAGSQNAAELNGIPADGM